MSYYTTHEWGSIWWWEGLPVPLAGVELALAQGKFEEAERLFRPLWQTLERLQLHHMRPLFSEVAQRLQQARAE